MRRIISLIAVLVMCVAVMCPFAVSADTFVPSIGYKDGPEIIDAEMESEDMRACLVVTSVLGAVNKTTDIHQSYRDLLLEVYAKLNDGSMKLPLPNNYVIRELVDINFKQTVCIEPGHTHMDDLAVDGITIDIDFLMGIKPDTEVIVLSYHDGEWEPIKSVVNNGDGTLTCEFEHFCPVAFCVREGGTDGPVQTGDANAIHIWIAVLAASLMGLALMVLPKLRKVR